MRAVSVIRLLVQRINLRLQHWLERIHPPGFRGIDAMSVLKIFFKDLNNYSFTLRATAMAFSFFFALFPTLIFLFALSPYLPIENSQARIETSLRGIFPGDAYTLISGTVAGVFQKQGAGVLSLAFGIIVFSSTRGIRTMLQAFSKADPTHFKPIPTWLLYWRSFYLFLSLSVLALIAIGILVGGEVVLRYIAKRSDFVESFYLLLYTLLNLVLNLGVIVVGISFIYYVAPSVIERWRFFTPGSFTAAFLMVLALFGLRFYFVNFSSYNGVYGSLAAVMVLMLWFYYVSLVLLVGFELNAAIDKAQGRQKMKDLALKSRGRRPKSMLVTERWQSGKVR